VKKIFLLAAIIFLVSAVTPAQETEVEKLTKNTDLLRQLYSEGLIARIELEKAEQDLTAAKTRVEETKKAEELSKVQAQELAKAQQLAKIKTFVKPTSMITRSTAGNWSIASLSTVQQFFSNTFRKPLPTSAVGQSATHNRMGWDHRNSVDVGLHPDSAEGRALIAYLQNAGIPYLAFRGTIPGVATGPHIHIGSPSHRL
jgi:thiamine biosynthesis lipoprotein ApbE